MKVILFVTLMQALFVSPAIAADVNAKATYTSGVAPLAVTFNAGIWTSSGTEHRFHNYEYSWDFDDDSSGTWWSSGVSKDVSNGPIASHVFNDVGTYTVTLTVRDSSTGDVVSSEGETFEITVTDPDTVFSGTNTVCISSVAQDDFTDCPSGATQVTTDSIDDISSYTGANRRVLFDRGSTWVISTPMTTTAGSPCVIAAYGSCVSPDAAGRCSNAPHITSTSTTQPVINLTQRTGFRVSDIYISGTGVTSTAAGVAGSNSNVGNLLQRLVFDGFNNNLSFNPDRSDDTDATKVAKNTVTLCKFGLANTMSWVGGEYFSITGNEFIGADQHTLRVWQMYIGTISHNYISGSGVEEAGQTDYGGHALNLHGPTDEITDGSYVVGNYATTGADGMEHRTRYVNISYNVFGGSGPWTVVIQPQNGDRDERLSDIIVEKNKFLTDYGEVSLDLVQVSAHTGADYLTFRNNIFDGSGGVTAWNYVGVVASRMGSEPAHTGFVAYNNTFYHGGHGVDAVIVAADSENSVVRNIFAAGSTGTALTDNSGTGTGSNNVFTTTPFFTDPDNANPLLRDFHLTSSSTAAIDQGYTVPLLDDFDGDLRTTPYDIGAYLYELFVDSIIYSGVTIQ